eukprot:CAMPEP_0114545698 /NCGR_PEP_ID=MMETSP0114-20121206/3550_1 /TAXON_ID=31324 /ORGANISM="Goniomonas sp, Strain m" /LENGTH=56 /DNA_ID=CAMNT_0001730165 /DNA_START=30 /DNA_END=200 /DNA_ORIENTATION=+
MTVNYAQVVGLTLGVCAISGGIIAACNKPAPKTASAEWLAAREDKGGNPVTAPRKA